MSVIDRAVRLIRKRYSYGEPLTSPEDTKRYLTVLLSEFKNEVFGCLFLNNRHHIIKYEILFYGTIDGASVHPRVVAQKALEHNAAAVVCFHNHPSGVAEPSRSDTTLTRRLSDSLGLLDIRLLDHFVVGEDVISFAERGLI